MLRKYNYIIIEDNPLAMRNLQMLLEDQLNLTEMDCFSSAEDAFHFLVQQPPNDLPKIIFLDLQMPRFNGLHFLNAIENLKPHPKVIAVTSHKEYLLNSYDYCVSGYVLKPVEQDKLYKAIKKAISTIDDTAMLAPRPLQMPEPLSNDTKVLEARSEGDDAKVHLISLNDIGYISSDNNKKNKITIYTKDPDKAYLQRRTMKDMESKLELNTNKDFFRIHESYIVSRVHLTGYYPDYSFLYVIIGQKEKRLPVGSTYRKEVKAWIQGWANGEL